MARRRRPRRMPGPPPRVRSPAPPSCRQHLAHWHVAIRSRMPCERVETVRRPCVRGRVHRLQPPVCLPCSQPPAPEQSSPVEHSVRTALCHPRAHFPSLLSFATGSIHAAQEERVRGTHGRAPAASATAAAAPPLKTLLLDTLSPALACSVHTDDAVRARSARGGRAAGVNASAASRKHSPAQPAAGKQHQCRRTRVARDITAKTGNSSHVCRICTRADIVARAGPCEAGLPRRSRARMARCHCGDTFAVLCNSDACSTRTQRTRGRHMPIERQGRARGRAAPYRTLTARCLERPSCAFSF